MTRILNLSLIAGLLIAVGCKDNKAPTQAITKENTKLKAALEKLSPEDRQLVSQQRICPITQKELGSMDTPIKIMIKGQPVFLCCEGCKDKALADPDKTLQTVEESRSQIGRR